MSSARAQKFMDRLADAVGLSEAGRAFLIAAIDPFHDEPIHGLVGMPDGQNSASVIQVVQQTVTINAPSALGANDKWDAHIQSFPFDASTYVKDAYGYKTQTGTDTINNKRVPLLITDSPDTARAIWPVTITRGGPVIISGAGVNAFNSAVVNDDRFGLSPDPIYTEGLYRVISKGYEALSSGPEIYQSGVCYVYSQPSATADITQTQRVLTVDGAGVWQQGDMSVIDYPRLPYNVADVILIPGTQSWKAKDGCYIVDRMNDCEQQVFDGKYTLGKYIDWTANGARPVLNSDDGSLVAYVGDVVPPMSFRSEKFSGFSIPIPAISVPSVPGINFSAFHHSGAYFAGLNANDVLQVTVIWYIERLPSIQDKNLTVLARPTPPADFQALEMYNLIMSSMPVGMVHDANSFGDWFKDAVELVADNVAPALAAMPGTIGMVGKGITVANGLAKAIMPKKQKSIEVAPGQSYSSNPKAIVNAEVRNEILGSKNLKKKKKSKGLLNQVSTLGKKGLKKLIKKDVKKDMRKL